MADFKPQNLNLEVIYDDFDIIMVNKPPFMVVHPTKSHFENTIANGITHYIMEKNEKVKVRFVNRLDEYIRLSYCCSKSYTPICLSWDTERW